MFFDFDRVRGRKGIFGAALAAILAGVIIGCGGGGGGSSNPTTSSVTNGANNGATNSATNGNTNSSTNAGTNSATDGTTGATAGTGILPANEILYTDLTGLPDGSYNINAATPDGKSNKAIYADIPPTIQPVALNPSVKNAFVLAGAKSSTALYGIYSSNGLTITGAKQLVAPSYAAVFSLAISQDTQHIVFTAANSGNTSDDVYLLSSGGGTPTHISAGENVAISPDNRTIAYSSNVGLNLQIFLYDLVTGTSTQLTTDSTDHDFPQFSKDGTKLAYSKLNSSDNYGIAIIALKTKTEVDLPNSSQLYEIGASFNSADDTISFVGQSVGVYTIPASGATKETLVVPDVNTIGTSYWTTTGGRGIGGPGYATSRLRRRKSSGRTP